MDFNLDRKMTPEEIAKVEEMVNQHISESLPVVRVEMPREDAKYPDIVSVYFVGDQKSWFSAEFCGGPHVESTAEIGEGAKRFKIQKQENVGAGIKRVKGALI